MALNPCPECSEDVSVTDAIQWDAARGAYWHATCWLMSDERDRLWDGHEQEDA